MSWNQDFWEGGVDQTSSDTDLSSLLKDDRLFDHRSAPQTQLPNGHASPRQHSPPPPSEVLSSTSTDTGISSADSHSESHAWKLRTSSPISTAQSKSDLRPNRPNGSMTSSNTSLPLDAFSDYWTTEVTSAVSSPDNEINNLIPRSIPKVRTSLSEMGKKQRQSSTGSQPNTSLDSSGGKKPLEISSTSQTKGLRNKLGGEDQKVASTLTGAVPTAPSSDLNLGQQYSKVSVNSSKSGRDYTLHEYEKQKMVSRPHPYGRAYSHRYHYPPEANDLLSVGGELDEDEDDRVNAIICLVFFLMGLGLVVGFVCLIVHLSKQEDRTTLALGGGGKEFEEVLTEVYRQRLADLIESVTRSDQDRQLRYKNNSWITSPGVGVTRPPCGIHPPTLLGNTTDVTLNMTLDIAEIVANHSDVSEGGEWQPSSCVSLHRVAVVIPYRDRWDHLKVLLHYLIPVLKRQQVHFRIFVVEQFGNETFNKGRIMNAAFREAMKLFDFHCVAFHDVDLVPEDDRNMYTCTGQPKHMSIAIDRFQYVLPYEGLVGGVLMFKAEHFILVNGYSNMYWGWGAEDDDMTTRILHHGLRIYRPPSNIARYKMVKHDGRKGSEVAIRMKLLRSAAKRSKLEGLNNVQYRLLSTHVEKLFTHLIVDVGQP